MHLFMTFKSFMLSVKVLGIPLGLKHRSIELKDFKKSILIILEKGVLDVTAFGRHFNSRDVLCGKETYVEELDPEPSRVNRAVIDRYGDRWEITSGVRITTRKRFTKPVRLPVWIARSVSHPDIEPFGFNLGADPEDTLSTVFSIRHDPIS